MSSVVVDASVLIAVITNEPKKEKLVEQTQNVDLIAPSSIHWEIGNAFSAMLKRQRISVEKAVLAIEIYQKIPIRFVSVELYEALQLANKLDIYAYDAYLIRCAVKYKAPLLSLDRRLNNSAKSINVQVMEI